MNAVAPGLIVDVEARITKLERGLKQANDRQRKAAGEMERRAKQSADRIENTYGKMTRNVGAGFQRLVGPAVALAGIASLTQLAQKAHKLAEEYRGVENTLRSIGQAGDEAAEKLAGAAIRSGSNFQDMAATVARIQKATNAGYDETTRRVETLNKLLSVGGASGAEVNSVSLQLSQALSSGTLQGDELRSLREAAPVELLDAIARAAGGTRAELKQLGADGALTSDVVLRALDDLAATADVSFGKVEMTFDRAMTNVNTGLTTFVGRLDEGLGASERLATGIADLGDWLNNNAGAAEEFGRSVTAALQTADQVATEAKQAMTDLALTIHRNTIGSVIDLGDTFADTGMTIGETLERVIQALAAFSGACEGSAAAAREAFLKIPDAITGAMEAAINAVIGAVETMINRVLDGVRTVAEAVDSVTSQIPGTDGTDLASGVGTVSFDRVSGLKTNHSTRSVFDAYSEGYARGEQGFLDAAESVEGYFKGIKERYETNRAALERANTEDKARPAVTVDGGADKQSASGGSVGTSGTGGRNGGAGVGNARDYANGLKDLAPAMAEVTEAQERMQQGIEGVADAMAGALVSGQNLRQGLAQVFAGIAQDFLAQRLTSLIGGLLGPLMNFGDPLTMALRGAGAPVGFAEGGFTGPGGKYTPAGIVHAGEFVISKQAVDRIGIGNLEAMHRAAKSGAAGYVSGGRVGAAGKVSKAAGDSPRASTAAPAQNISLSPTINVNASGGTPEQNADLAKQVSAATEKAMRNLIRDEMVRQHRSGGILRR